MKKRVPFVSTTTLVTMIFALIITLSLFDDYLFLRIGAVWAICVAVLFLCECLFGLKKKPLSPNIGAFVATTVMTVAFVIIFVRNSLDGGYFLGIWQAIICITFLPPIVVSLAANVGNVIYKIKRGKAAE